MKSTRLERATYLGPDHNDGLATVDIGFLRALPIIVIDRTTGEAHEQWYDEERFNVPKEVCHEIIKLYRSNDDVGPDLLSNILFPHQPHEVDMPF